MRYDRTCVHVSVPTRRIWAAFVLFAIAVSLAAPSALAQGRTREGMIAIQAQVERIHPAMVKSTVALLRRGGTGSGVIISADGYVLTAAHVIAGSRMGGCQVLLSDGRRMRATVLGSSKDDDYGLIKIDDASNLPTAPLGDSSTLRRGQWVVAMGHPLGPRELRPPVLRLGRVTLLPRGDNTNNAGAVVTDAPIISGDSGGPLFDLNGRVVGINSMIMQGERRTALTSIHVPVNLPKAVMDVLKRGDSPTSDDVDAAPFEKWIAEGKTSLKAGDLEAAARAASKGVEADPTNAASHILAARVHAKKNLPAQALAALSQAADLGFNDVEYLKREADFVALVGHPGMQKFLDRLALISAVPGNRKSDRWLLAAADTVEPNLDRGSVRILSEGAQVALGTVMSADGDVLTKASELPDGTLTCVLPDGTKVAAERGKADTEWDVALLKISSGSLQTLPLTETGTAGRWTFTPDGTGAVAAIGVVGVTEMPVRGKGIVSKPTSKAYMGVMLRPLSLEALKVLGLTSGVAVQVEPGFPASSAGLRSGDVVFEMDGRPVRDDEGFMDFMVNKKPGDRLVLSIARADERLNITVNLTDRPADLPARGGLLAQLSGEISRVQGPFPQVLQHDSVLRPSFMGGPLMDIEGRLIGMNIARADRAATYAIPTKDLKALYAKLKQ